MALKNILLGIMMFAITALFSPVAAHAMQARAFDNARGDTCSAYTPEIEISYTQGDDSLTARVVVQNEAEKSLRSTAQISWSSPTGERGHSSARGTEGAVVMPMKGHGTYSVSATVTFAGCERAVTIDDSMTLIARYIDIEPDGGGGGGGGCGGGGCGGGGNDGGGSNGGGCGQGSTLNGSWGSDTIHGTSKNDYINGKPGKDHLYGHGCDDNIRGGSGKDYIYGGSGRDTIYGNSGKDTIHGNSGNDWIHGGWGKDVCYGGPGIDTFISCHTAYQD